MNTDERNRNNGLSNISASPSSSESEERRQKIESLKSKLLVECEKRGLPGPQIEFSVIGSQRDQVFAKASWPQRPNLKVITYPTAFPKEDAACIYVLQKALCELKKIAICKESRNEIVLETRTAVLTSDPIADSKEVPKPVISHELLTKKLNLHAHDETRLTESVDQQNFQSKTSPLKATPTCDLVAEQTSEQKTAEVVDPKMFLPAINTSLDRGPPSEGFIVVLLEKNIAMVQVKGPGLSRWESQTYEFSSPNPVESFQPNRWYVVSFWQNDQNILERAMIAHGEPTLNEQGFIEMYFADNGFSDFVDPNTVFELKNYDEVALLPPQSIPLHIIGVTGHTKAVALDEICSPTHDVVFLPANRQACSIPSCTAGAAHAFVYDKAAKKILKI